MYTLKDISEAEYRRFVEETSDTAEISQIQEPSGLFEESSDFALEKFLQEFIASNFDNIFKGSLVMYVDGAGGDGQQYETNIVGRIDILAVEPKSDSFVVIELKRGMSSDQVVGQVLRYMGWVKSKLCKDGQQVKGLIICRERDPKLDYALTMTNNIEVRYYEVNFKLKETPQTERLLD